MNNAESTIRELARGRIIAKKIGLISEAELQSWADAQIRLVPAPCFFLISISMGDENELNFSNRLDLVQERPGDQDSASIAGEILEQLETGKLDMEGLEAIALNCESLLNQDSDSWAKFSWIADEIYLAREGAKNRASCHAEVFETLRSMLP